jgi:membrane-associated phospholipid phosphatase
MRGFRFPTRDELEKFIPYPFIVAWIAGGITVFAVANVSQRGSAGIAHNVLVGVVAGYFAGGILVSVLSAAHSCLERFLGEKNALTATGCHAHACVSMPTASVGMAPNSAAAPDCVSESRLRLMFLGFLLAAAAALGLDCPLAQWCLAENCPRLLHDLLEVSSVLGTGMATLLIVVAIHQLDPRRRRALGWVVACVLLSGFAANGAKMLVARTRPRDIDFPADVRTTFAGWLPPTSVLQSFPSGHAATAAGLALALLPLYPSGRRLFLLPAVLVACQRVECGAHYLCDVLCGAAVSCLTVACCLRLGHWFPWFHPLPPHSTPGP